jgi:hypothetical protein
MIIQDMYKILYGIKIIEPKVCKPVTSFYEYFFYFTIGLLSFGAGYYGLLYLDSYIFRDCTPIPEEKKSIVLGKYTPKTHISGKYCPDSPIKLEDYLYKGPKLDLNACCANSSTIKPEPARHFDDDASSGIGSDIVDIDHIPT